MMSGRSESCLYELLTGELPWRTPPDLRERLLREIQTVRPPHPSEVYSRAPRAFGDVAMRMLEMDPALRLGASAEVIPLLGAAGEKSDVLSPLPPRRSASRGLTSDATPTERVPELMGNQRGHIAARMAVAMVAGFALFVAGGVSVMTGWWEVGRRQGPGVQEALTGAAPSPVGPAIANVFGGLKMPDKPQSNWLRPGKDGLCRHPATGEVRNLVIRGSCWELLAKWPGEPSCPKGLYDPPPEVLKDPKQTYLRNSCFAPWGASDSQSMNP